MAYSNYYAASGLFHGSMSSVMVTQFDILIRRVRFHLLTGKPGTTR